MYGILDLLGRNPWTALGLFLVVFAGCQTGQIERQFSAGAPIEIKPSPVPEDVGIADLEPQFDENATNQPEPANVPLSTVLDLNKQSFKIRGRVEADAIFASQSERDKALVGDLQNVVGFRRARLGAEGTIGEQVRWEAEFDFAGGNVAFRDVFIAVYKLPMVGEIRVGNFREPYALEGQTSSNYFTFVERSPIDALDPGRHWGVGVFNYAPDERATFAAGAFRSGSNSFGNDVGDGNDMAYTFRLTGLPWRADEDRLLHLGGAFSQRYPKNEIVSFNQGPGNSLLQASDNPLVPFVANIQIPASQYQLYNAEFALVLGPLSVQAEWDAASIDQIGGGPVFLHGSYAFVSYFLTGEHRAYNAKTGAFGMINVLAPFIREAGSRDRPIGWGAWELAARLAYLDFDNPNIAPQPNGLRVGDRLTTATFGVNWYLNDYTRVMFNYVHAIPVDPNFGPSAADVFFLRFALFW